MLKHKSKASEIFPYTHSFYKFFLLWTTLKIFIEFVTILLPFSALVFWPWGMWDLSSPTKDWSCTPCLERQSLNHWTTRKAPLIHSLLYKSRQEHLSPLLPNACRSIFLTVIFPHLWLMVNNRSRKISKRECQNIWTREETFISTSVSLKERTSQGASEYLEEDIGNIQKSVLGNIQSLHSIFPAHILELLLSREKVGGYLEMNIEPVLVSKEVPKPRCLTGFCPA